MAQWMKRIATKTNNMSSNLGPTYIITDFYKSFSDIYMQTHGPQHAHVCMHTQNVILK